MRKLTSFEENHNFSNKNDHLPAWRKIDFFLPYVLLDLSNGPVIAKNLPRFQFEGISQVRHVRYLKHFNPQREKLLVSMDYGLTLFGSNS